MRTSCFVSIAAAAGILAASGVSAAERDLKTAFFIPTSKSLFRQAFDDFVAKLNDVGSGQIKVSKVVSREAVPAGQMPTALKSGVLELLGAPPGYFERLVPGSSGLSAPRASLAEQKKNGAWALMQKEFAQKANARLLAQYGFGVRFHLFTSVPIRSLSEFKGVKFRTSPTTRAFVEALGGQPIVMGRGEIFTAMERGVVQGFSNLNSEIKALGWGDVVKYRIDPSFYDTMVFAAINLDVWKSLNATQKAKLEEAANHLETTLNDRIAARDVESGKSQIKAGVFQAIALPPQDAKRYVDLAYKGMWDTVVKRSPEFGARVRKLLGAE